MVKFQASVMVFTSNSASLPVRMRAGAFPAGMDLYLNPLVFGKSRIRSCSRAVQLQAVRNIRARQTGVNKVRVKDGFLFIDLIPKVIFPICVKNAIFEGLL